MKKIIPMLTAFILCWEQLIYMRIEAVRTSGRRKATTNLIQLQYISDLAVKGSHYNRWKISMWEIEYLYKECASKISNS